eukprot:1321205-Amphidinium_carterae.1
MYGSALLRGWNTMMPSHSIKLFEIGFMESSDETKQSFRFTNPEKRYSQTQQGKSPKPNPEAKPNKRKGLRSC